MVTCECVRSGHGCREGGLMPERKCESALCPVCPDQNFQHETLQTDLEVFMATLQSRSLQDSPEPLSQK